MASNTENLNLLMKNPSTDGADTFNIQTMLNENWQKIDNNAGTVAQTLANILKPTTPPLIGLPPSTTPDGMFQALGNTGELHVWRKTVVTGTAKVELEPAVSGYIVSNNGSNYNQTIKYSSTIDEKGNLSGTITTLTVAYNTSNSDLFVLKGKYFEAGTTEISSNLKSPGGVWYIPNDASIQYITGQPNTTGYPYYYTHVATKMQKVVYVPAGTTTTYPVSTNPNAYQEGDDAKPAGYTLGEVVNGNFQVGYPSNVSEVNWNYSDALNVADNGTLTLKNPLPAKINTATSSGYQNPSVLLGHFAVVTGHKENIPGSPFADEQIVYIPSNAVVSGMYIDRYQPVTGYAAIPAGTTIEYLGKLGDKARVQVVSYVGTGTYGSSNPNSLTFDFVPKVVRLLGNISSGGSFTVCRIYPMNTNYGINSAILFTKALTTTYKASLGFSENNYTASYCKISQDGKTVTWYNNGDDQINTAGYTYYFLALG